ncbi:hypothetical protein BLNAU_10759 [Blattamonas nauphoetae]|uniref:Uncharacterized protein n=1 Tax=Blattamonas nauphoetae TaxID=2049346 RepID=A0ABQ9XRG6_9EUKA|nr:hypothetical protein BLNAU_10759 [Blattamonas nauphoetae]
MTTNDEGTSEAMQKDRRRDGDVEARPEGRDGDVEEDVCERSQSEADKSRKRNRAWLNVLGEVFTNPSSWSGGTGRVVGWTTILVPYEEVNDDEQTHADDRLPQHLLRYSRLSIDTRVAIPVHHVQPQEPLCGKGTPDEARGSHDTHNHSQQRDQQVRRWEHVECVKSEDSACHSVGFAWNGCISTLLLIRQQPFRAVQGMHIEEPSVAANEPLPHHTQSFPLVAPSIPVCVPLEQRENVLSVGRGGIAAQSRFNGDKIELQGRNQQEQSLQLHLCRVLPKSFLPPNSHNPINAETLRWLIISFAAEGMDGWFPSQVHFSRCSAENVEESMLLFAPPHLSSLTQNGSAERMAG